MSGLRELTESVGRAVLDGVGRVASRVQERKPLPADLLESDGAYLVVFDAPGAEMEDVNVNFERGRVRVRIERFRDLYDGYEMRFPGRGMTLEGSVELPAGASVDPGAATATLAKNGTLRVEIPKVEDGDAPVTIQTGEEIGEEALGEADEPGSGDASPSAAADANEPDEGEPGEESGGEPRE